MFKVCTTLSDSEYDVLARGVESVRWKCPNCIAEGAKSSREHTSRTEAKLDMIVKLFQDIGCKNGENRKSVQPEEYR